MCKKAAEEAFVIIFYRGLIAHSRLSGTIKKPFVTFDIKPALSIKYSIRSDLATFHLKARSIEKLEVTGQKTM